MNKINLPNDWRDSIAELMHPHLGYLEPFAGGLAVLWRKNPEGIIEVVSDLNGDLINFYRVLKDEGLFARFQRAVEFTRFARREWEEARRRLREEPEANKVERAVWFFALNRMSHAGRMDAFTGVTKSRSRGGMSPEVYAWLGCIEGLPAVHERLRRVLIEDRPAIELMRSYDIEGWVQYLDPPYPAETRSSPSVYGKYEMTNAQHEEFLETANALKNAKALISSYHSKMYDRALQHWNRHEFEIANHSAGGKKKERKIEVVWTNY